MSRRTPLLALDAGQTGIKVRVRQDGGSEDILLPGIRTAEPLLPQLAAAVHETMARTGVRATAVAAGVSGLTSKEADASALLALLYGSSVREVALAHDSTTSFLGAMRDARGAVVAAGGGVVTLAVGRTEVARVDGWGYLMGDAGSGFWIGREALEAVMRAYDGRGPETALRDVAQQHWPDLSEAYIDLQSSHDRVATVASFASHVARLAAAGDEVARRISLRAGYELAHSVETALRRVLEQSEPAGVCAIGGVFRSVMLHDAFVERLKSGPLDVTLREPAGEGIDGVIALLGLGTAHPLASAVSTAGA